MAADYATSLHVLRSYLAGFTPGNEVYDEIVGHRAEVLSRFGPLFAFPRIPLLAKDEFTPFLYFAHNHHWTSLHRKGLRLTLDMPGLRRTLAILLDEARPIRQRFPEALASAKGLGKAIATAILTVAYPTKYGVWNSTSEDGLARISAWPSVRRGEGLGGQYERINILLNRLASDLGMDLWTLDALWWFVLGKGQLPASATR